MMKLQDVLLKAMAKKITWWEAAEIIVLAARSSIRTLAGLKRRRVQVGNSRLRKGAGVGVRLRCLEKSHESSLHYYQSAAGWLRAIGAGAAAGF
jgi:hypothetical protein